MAKKHAPDETNLQSEQIEKIDAVEAEDLWENQWEWSMTGKVDSSKKDVSDTFSLAKTKYWLSSLGDEKKEKELRMEAKTLVRDALQAGPDGIKTKVQIKNIWTDVKKSKMLLTKLGELRGISEWSEKVYKQLQDIEWDIREKFEEYVGGTWKLRSITKYIPWIWNKINEKILDQENLSRFLDWIQEVLEDASKDLLDQITELEAQKGYLAADAKALKEQFYLMQYVSEELSNQILALPEDSKELVVFKDEMKRTLMIPVMQKATAIAERVVVDINWYQQCNILQQTAENLKVAVNKTQEVTLHALQTQLTSQVAIGQQNKIFEGIDSLNKLASDLIVSTSQQIKEQSSKIARKTLETSTNMDAVKESFKNIEMAVKEVNDIYQKSLPEMKNTIKQLEDIVDKWMEKVEANEALMKTKGDLLEE